jgi:hypothetical protein
MPQRFLCCFFKFYSPLKPQCLHQFNCYITSANALNLEALKLTLCRGNERNFLGLILELLNEDVIWLNEPVCRQSVEETGHNSFTFTSRGIVANNKENRENISRCNQKFELVIPQLTILLP